MAEHFSNPLNFCDAIFGEKGVKGYLTGLQLTSVIVRNI